MSKWYTALNVLVMDFWSWLDPFWSLLTEVFGAFNQPKRRIYYPYLLSALGLGLLYLRYAGGAASWRAAWRPIFDPKIWGHPSTRADAALFVFNTLLRILLLAPYMLSHLAFAYVVVRWWEALFGLQDALNWSSSSINWTYSVVFLVVSDFSRFWWHYLLHRIPWLWEIHKVHHAAEVMTPLTLYRVHPLEYLWFRLRSLVVFGLVTGSFFYWFRTGMEPWSILKIHAGLFLFNLLGANLRHSHIPFSFGRVLEHCFISPAQHQLHHSQAPEHHNKNMGSLFAIWDALFGSLLLSRPRQQVAFGIETADQPHYRSFWQNLWTPFLRLWQVPKQWWISRRNAAPTDTQTRSTSSP